MLLLRQTSFCKSFAKRSPGHLDTLQQSGEDRRTFPWSGVLPSTCLKMRADRRSVVCSLLAAQVLLAAAGSVFHVHRDAASNDDSCDVVRGHCCSHHHAPASEPTGDAPETPTPPHDHENCVVCQYYAHMKSTTVAAVVVTFYSVVERRPPVLHRRAACAPMQVRRSRAPPHSMEEQFNFGDTRLA